MPQIRPIPPDRDGSELVQTPQARKLHSRGKEEGGGGGEEGEEKAGGADPGATRGKDGRFVAGDGGGGGGRDAGADGQSGGTGKREGEGRATGGRKPTPAPQVLDTGEVVLGGKKYKDLAHLQQAVASFLGHARTAQQREAELSRRVEELEKSYTTAAHTASQWAAAYQRDLGGGGNGQGQGQGQQMQQQQQAAGAGVGAGEQERKQLPELLNAEVVNFLAKTTDQAAISRYMMELVGNYVGDVERRFTESLDERIRSAVAPLEQYRDQMTATNAHTAIVMRAANERKADGSLRYPELTSNRSAAGKIMEKWGALPPDLRFADDLRGFKLAYLDYRDERDASQTQQRDAGGDLLDLGGGGEDFTMDADDHLGTPRPGDGGEAGQSRADLARELVSPGGTASLEDADAASLLPSI